MFTEGGEWLVLDGNNGFTWSNIHYALELKLREYNKNREIVTSVSFNDRGDWIIISDEHFSSSSAELNTLIQEVMKEKGQLWSAHLTNDGAALCFQYGYYFIGNVPLRMREALKSSKLDVYRIKFTPGGAYFFSDKQGNYRAYM